ncbi:ribosomal-protein-alanine acetyltransferase [Caldinitratiruptor microaerophilus]|uniref:Ribosomal-protein-alanine acetyltransferase n=2 Tax=Caldinitratiruptor microaerophilus TaxID=671077 RepID=A0AA35CPE8_9FIRM|nr:ribosomal-protein-alanine acetyltransferase [Caldinitratiruptor microaerophilus]
MKDEGVEIVPMSLADIDGVMVVERLSFPTTWSRQAFVHEVTANTHARYFVARAGRQVVGYGGMWLILDEAHVTNIAVHPDWRGRGIGEALMRRLMDCARSYGITRMTLEVRVSNHAAQNLYVKLGFRPAGIRKGYYTDTHEDALIMWLDPIPGGPADAGGEDPCP